MAQPGTGREVGMGELERALGRSIAASMVAALAPSLGPLGPAAGAFGKSLISWAFRSPGTPRDVVDAAEKVAEELAEELAAAADAVPDPAHRAARRAALSEFVATLDAARISPQLLVDTQLDPARLKAAIEAVAPRDALASPLRRQVVDEALARFCDRLTLMAIDSPFVRRAAMQRLLSLGAPPATEP
jgi:hypothetical protein